MTVTEIALVVIAFALLMVGHQLRRIRKALAEEVSYTDSGDL